MSTSDAISAVIVNYNAGEHLLACVRSLRVDGVAEVIVVDNASTDGSLAALAAGDPDTRIVHAGGNLGYGRAANRGAALAAHDLVLVLNPDVVVEPGTLKALTGALTLGAGTPGDRLGIVGPRIEMPDGRLYPSARTFPSLVDAIGHGFLGLVAPRNPWSRRYKLLDWDHAGFTTVDWVSGACLLARRQCYEQIGGFDEAYFMYLEDVDLCWRAWRAGWQVGYEPAARVAHVQGVSTDQRPYRMIVAHHESLWRFARRTTSGAKRVLLPVVGVGLAVRCALACGQRWQEGRRARKPGALR